MRTTVTARKPHLEHVRLFQSVAVSAVLTFQLIVARLLRFRLGCGVLPDFVNPRLDGIDIPGACCQCRRYGRLGHLAWLHTELCLPRCWPVEEVGFELRAALVEGDRMAERADCGVVRHERETLRNEAYGAHRVPIQACRLIYDDDGED